MRSAWPQFRGRREQRLREHERFGHAAERAPEAILDDLFVTVLDWSVADLNHQVGYTDLLLTRLGIKYLIVEAKRPGSLAGWRASSTCPPRTPRHAGRPSGGERPSRSGARTASCGVWWS